MHIKINNEVKNKEDVKNLVTSVILRQTKPFKTSQIQKAVNFYLHGSEFHNKYKLIRELVDCTLDVCLRRDIVARWAGIWYPTQIDGSFIPEYYEAKRNCL